jgi:hypothetical protein
MFRKEPLFPSSFSIARAASLTSFKVVDRKSLLSSKLIVFSNLLNACWNCTRACGDVVDPITVEKVHTDGKWPIAHINKHLQLFHLWNWLLPSG